MSFLDLEKLGDQISSKGKEVVGKAKEVAEAAKLNGKVTSEESKLNNTYASFGKTFFESHAEAPDESYEKDFQAVKDSKATLEKLKYDLQKIKGVRPCSNCGADVPLTAAFCSACGARNDIIEPVQPEEEKEPESANTEDDDAAK